MMRGIRGNQSCRQPTQNGQSYQRQGQKSKVEGKPRGQSPAPALIRRHGNGMNGVRAPDAAAVVERHFVSCDGPFYRRPGGDKLRIKNDGLLLKYGVRFTRLQHGFCWRRQFSIGKSNKIEIGQHDRVGTRQPCRQNKAGDTTHGEDQRGAGERLRVFRI